MIVSIFQEHGINIDVNFSEELENFGFNSRCYIELVVRLEKFYDITISDEDLDFNRFKTVNDICEMLRHYINGG